MFRTTAFVAVAGLAIAVGCSGSDTDADDMQEEVTEAAEAVSDFAGDRARAAREALEQELEALDGELEEMREQARTAGDEAREDLEAAIAELEAERRDLAEELRGQ